MGEQGGSCFAWGSSGSLLRMPVQWVVASYAGAEGLCTASRGSKALLQVRGQGGRCFACRCRGSLLRLPVQWVVASHAGAVGRCFVCRCSGSLHPILRQRVLASSPGAWRSLLHLPCRGSLLRMPGQGGSCCGGEAFDCTASRCGARHRARMSTSVSVWPRAPVAQPMGGSMTASPTSGARPAPTVAARRQRRIVPGG